MKINKMNLKLCDYGCGSKGHFILKNGKSCCSETFNKCSAYRDKLSKAAKRCHADGRIPGFSKEAQSKSNAKKIDHSIEKAFVENSAYSNLFIKPRLIKYFNVEEKCSICGISEWNGKPLTLELEHKNGNNRDNRVENLCLICPNCHSQTETFRGRNINNGLQKVSDEEIKEAASICSNIRQILLAVKLTPKGANYARVRKILEDIKQ